MATKTTKQLARELGLLRKRKVCGTPSKGKKSKIEQIFSYLIVLDFESTCWENEKTVPQEIIEFPAVLLNCTSGQIESTFHHYVLPSEHPRLSEFCQKLTGISQDQVDNGIPLSFCLRKFFYWLKKIQTDKGVVCVSDKHFSSSDDMSTTGNNKQAAFVTWSDWDLGVCLLNETKRKQIMKPSSLDRWIDLRATYRKFYGRRPDGLNGAMKDLGLQFDGREHSGIDDAKNTAQLAYRMICDGCIFQITKSLKMNLTGIREKNINPANSCHAKNLNIENNTSLSKHSHGLSFVIKEDEQVTGDTILKLKPGKANGLSLRCTNVSGQQTHGNKINKYSHNLSSIPSAKSSKKCFDIYVDSNTCQSPVKQSSSVGEVKSSLTSAPLLPRVQSSSSASTSERIPVNTSKSTPSNCKMTSPSSLKSTPLNSKINTHTSISVRSVSSTIHKTWPSLIKKTSVPNARHYSLDSRNNTHGTCASSFNSPPSLPLISSSSSSLSTSSTFKTPQNPPHPLAKKTNNKSSIPTLSAPFKSPATSYSATKTNCIISTSSSLKTPIHSTKSSVMRVTPPLCSCGRRSRRRLVQNPGPNEGRWFFSCTAGSRSCGDKSFSGCGFFQWEST